MDLALAFGRYDLTAFKRSLSERDLARWMGYASRRLMPMRKIELYLAQICLMIARGPLQDANELTIDDFIFKVDDRKDEDEPDIEAMRAALGWTPPPEE